MHPFRRKIPIILRQVALAGLGVMAVALAPWAQAQRIFPEALPEPEIAGFSFPESEATLTGWITAMTRGNASTGVSAAERIYRHGWGLWTAVTMETAQQYEGQRLRVFETWLTPEELASASKLPSGTSVSSRSRGRAPLEALNQLKRGHENSRPSGLATSGGDNRFDRGAGFVKFDPTAAEHVRRQRLFDTAALDALLLGGAQQITPFPATALVVKPVFQIVKAGDLVGGRYYALKVWPGPPEVAQPWGPAQWPGCVWLDQFDGGAGRGAIDETPQADGSTRTDETTYPLSSLIHYRLSAADAAALNEAKPGTDARVGDFAILVAMHIAGREIARWTWQTFWWTPTPDDPHAPSGPVIASQRPDQLQGAARNYAMALAYTMLTPDQPYVGGENVGAAVYAYNPWIEARFGPTDLPDSRAGFDPAGRPAENNHGVQTNCMSCHAQATYNPNKRSTAPRFTGARYVDVIDPQFVGTLQTDFLWSIPRHAVAQSAVTAAPAPIVPLPLPAPDFGSARDVAVPAPLPPSDLIPFRNRRLAEP